MINQKWMKINDTNSTKVNCIFEWVIKRISFIFIVIKLSSNKIYLFLLSLNKKKTLNLGIMNTNGSIKDMSLEYMHKYQKNY